MLSGCDVLRKLEFIYDEYRQILKFPSISIIIFAKKLTSAKKHLHVIIKMVKNLHGVRVFVRCVFCNSSQRRIQFLIFNRLLPSSVGASAVVETGLIKNRFIRTKCFARNHLHHFSASSPVFSLISFICIEKLQLFK